MIFLSNLFGIAGFRIRALQSLATRRIFSGAIACFGVGFIVYALIRNWIYAALPEIQNSSAGIIAFIYRLNLIQVLVFLSLVYIPILVLFSRVMRGERTRFSIFREEYRMHVSVFFPIWGLVYLVAAPVQWIIPHFLILGDIFEISVGYIIRTLLVTVYTVWILKSLNKLTTAQACGVFVLSLITLPVMYFLVNYDFLNLP
jgi:hypothetical protein